MNHGVPGSMQGAEIECLKQKKDPYTHEYIVEGSN